MKSSPRSPQLEKAHAQQRRPNAAENKLKKKEGSESSLIPLKSLTHQWCLKWIWPLCGQVVELTVGKDKEEVCMHCEVLS